MTAALISESAFFVIKHTLLTFVFDKFCATNVVKFCKFVPGARYLLTK